MKPLRVSCFTVERNFLPRDKFVSAECVDLDVKLNLQDTDYGQFLADEEGTLTASVIQRGTINKLVNEFVFLRTQVSEPLGKFMDFIT